MEPSVQASEWVAADGQPAQLDFFRQQGAEAELGGGFRHSQLRSEALGNQRFSARRDGEDPSRRLPAVLDEVAVVPLVALPERQERHPCSAVLL